MNHDTCNCETLKSNLSKLEWFSSFWKYFLIFQINHNIIYDIIYSQSPIKDPILTLHKKVQQVDSERQISHELEPHYELNNFHHATEFFHWRQPRPINFALLLIFCLFWSGCHAQTANQEREILGPSLILNYESFGGHKIDKNEFFKLVSISPLRHVVSSEIWTEEATLDIIQALTVWSSVRFVN